MLIPSWDVLKTNIPASYTGQTDRWKHRSKDRYNDGRSTYWEGMKVVSLNVK